MLIDLKVLNIFCCIFWIDTTAVKFPFELSINLSDRITFNVCSGVVQEGIASTPRMGAPLILTKNRNGSPEAPKPEKVVEEEKTIEEATPEKEEDSTVNGKLNINIKENSIIEKPDNKTTTQYPQFNDFRHNYHWFTEFFTRTHKWL